MLKPHLAGSLTCVLALVLLMLSLYHSQCAAVQQSQHNSDQSSADRFNHAATRFQEEVSFACNFAYEFGTADTWDDAWVQALKVIDPPAKNSLAKRGPDLCLQLRDESGESTFQLLSFDGLGVRIDRAKMAFNFQGPENARRRGPFSGLGHDSLAFSPFFQLGGQNGKVIEPLMDAIPEGAEARIQVEIGRDQRIVLTQTIKSKTIDSSIESNTTFQLFDGVPLLVERSYQETHLGIVGLRSKAVLMDFVPCGKVHMASKMARVMERLDPATGKLAAVLYWKWQSNDLGQHEPVDQDFEFILPKDIKLPRHFQLPDGRIVDQELMEKWNIALLKEQLEQLDK